MNEVAFGMQDADGGPRGGGRGLFIIEQLSDGVEYLNNGSTIRIGFAR